MAERIRDPARGDAGRRTDVGLEDEVGSLEIGKKADIVLLNLDAWPFVPLNDPRSTWFTRRTAHR